MFEGGVDIHRLRYRYHKRRDRGIYHSRLRRNHTVKESRSRPLLVGEVFVDYTITAAATENKLRLGGVVHAARAFWAFAEPFDAAVILPDYLVEPTRRYLISMGCVEFYVLGTVRGAPNVMAIFDATEVVDQGYENLMSDEKSVDLRRDSLPETKRGDALIFPGFYDLNIACSLLPSDIRLHLDVAYDVATVDDLASLPRPVETILLSTSSPLFSAISPSGVEDLLDAFAACAPKTLILKENRGGSRLIDAATRSVERLAAQLGSTVNSVGVGDVFAAAYLTHLKHGSALAGWRATYASAAYSQTTYPDLFRTYVQRDLALSLDEMQNLWGAFLPWEQRQSVQIYFAAPDFTNARREAMDRALASLAYHNFRVRRPVLENGELPAGSDIATLRRTYEADRAILNECNLERLTELI